ncbi:MAG: radical SAM protein [Candidatus Omnitrophota bacterium]|nr:radical SAM protein [Candidatus Omnitrophota bacterium]
MSLKNKNNIWQVVPWVKHKIYRASVSVAQNLDKNWRVKYIQLEITYRCNKLCSKCNRFCNLGLPHLKDADMKIEQIEKFINQVRQKNIRLKRIQILGGEPFLHPRLHDFISLLFYELMVPGNLARIEIYTNGIIGSSSALKECRLDANIDRAFNEKKIEIIASPKEAHESFIYVLSAPVDLGLKWDVCSLPRECGVLLNAYGYWPGGTCGPIAMLFGLAEYAKYDFPERFMDAWPNLRKDICRYCVSGCKALADKREGCVTPSFKDAISNRMKASSVPKKF